MTRSSPGTERALRLLQECPCFCSEVCGILPCACADALAAALAGHAQCVLTDDQLRAALEFGIWSCAGPTNDQEVEMLERQIEETWQEYSSTLKSTDRPEFPPGGSHERPYEEYPTVSRHEGKTP